VQPALGFPADVFHLLVEPSLTFEQSPTK